MGNGLCPAHSRGRHQNGSSQTDANKDSHADSHPNKTDVTPTPTRTTGIFVPTEVPCPPGFTRQWCKEHTPTPTATTVGEDDSGDGGNTGNTNVIPVPPPPLQTPLASRFGVNVTYKSVFKMDSSLLVWKVFQPGSVSVQVSAHSSINIDEYEFRLKVNPGDTGFYAVHNNSLHCSPTRPGDAVTDWYQTDVFYPQLIRCGVGLVTNSGFEVEAQRRGTTGRGFRIQQTRNVTQAWHQEDGRVTYSVDFSAINEGTRPVWVDASYFDSDDSALGVSAVATATKALEGHIGDVFSENDSSYEMTIKPAWIFSGVCGLWTAIACVKPQSNVYSGPHMNAQEMWFIYPPRGRLRHKTTGVVYVPEWTDDPKKINNPDLQGVYHSINAVMAHEFGHTLGLTHLPDVPDPDANDSHDGRQGTQWLKDQRLSRQRATCTAFSK